MKRRTFLKQSAVVAAALTGGLPLDVFARDEMTELVILHTNDVHSRIDPFPSDHKRYPGMGGAAARSAIIRKIRSENRHVLLLDAGDILQGTPYFNFFDGELEFNLMDRMGYDAATIGNHDFDAGIEQLAKLAGSVQFPLLNCNYDFSETPMISRFQPYKIIRKGRLKIGITGVGVEIDGLVPAKLYGKTRYLDPVESVNRVANHLRHHEDCDFIIVLSHLGYEYSSDKISDRKLAAASQNVDLIIGGHTHTFLDDIQRVHNSEGDEVMITQVGWAGVYLGKVNVYFHKKNRKKYASGQTVIVDKKSIAI